MAASLVSIRRHQDGLEFCSCSDWCWYLEQTNLMKLVRASQWRAEEEKGIEQTEVYTYSHGAVLIKADDSHCLEFCCSNCVICFSATPNYFRGVEHSFRRRDVFVWMWDLEKKNITDVWSLISLSFISLLLSSSESSHCLSFSRRFYLCSSIPSLPPPPAECGGRFKGESSGRILSPGYPFPYDNNLRCTWVIEVDSGNIVRCWSAFPHTCRDMLHHFTPINNQNQFPSPSPVDSNPHLWPWPETSAV